MIFELTNDKLKAIKQEDFKLEKDVQDIVDKNMTELLGIQFLTSQFPVDSYILDSVAYNKESNSFVIIEYKKVKCEHMVEQGIAYVVTMLNKRSEFVLLYNKVTGDNKQVGDFDWSQSRIVFISPYFTDYQLDASAYMKLPIEMYTIKKYGKTILFEKVESSKKLSKADNPTQIFLNDKAKTAIDEVKVYTEQDHMEKIPSAVLGLYNNLKEKVSDIGELKIEPKKFYIAFKATTNVFDVCLQKSKIKVWINLRNGQLKDPQSMAYIVEHHWGNGDYEINLTKESQIDYIVGLIKQSWDVNK